MLDEANVKVALVKLQNKAIEEFLAKIDQEVSFKIGAFILPNFTALFELNDW
jgi:hypothetical protein